VRNLGGSSPDQAQQLKEAGLDYYNTTWIHRLSYYGEIITTRTTRTASTPWCCSRGRFEGVLWRHLLARANGDRPRAAVCARSRIYPPEASERCPSISSFKCPARRLHGKAGVTRSDFVRTIAVARFSCLLQHVRLSRRSRGMSD